MGNLKCFGKVGFKRYRDVMGKLFKRAQMKKNDMDKVFRKLNLKVRSTGHNYEWLVFNSKKILRVHYSHGKGDIPEKIANKIRGQLKLSDKDFKSLLDCPLKYEEYIAIFKTKGLIV